MFHSFTVNMVTTVTVINMVILCPLKEEEQSACSDGIFNGVRYFTCPAGRGFFTLLTHCRQDSRFAPNTPNSDTSFNSEKGTCSDHLAFSDHLFGSQWNPVITTPKTMPKCLCYLPVVVCIKQALRITSRTHVLLTYTKRLF